MLPLRVRQKTQYYGFMIVVCQWKRVFIWGGGEAYKKLPYYLSMLLQHLLETEEHSKPFTNVSSRLRIYCAHIQYKEMISLTLK